MQANPQLQIDNAPTSRAQPQTGWISRLYRLQVWIYLLVGTVPLIVGLPSVFSWLMGSSTGDSFSFGLWLMFAALPGLVLVLFNVIALNNRSAFGWWLHFLSISLVSQPVLNPLQLWGIFPAPVPVLGLSLLSLTIAVVAKRALFGKIGIVAPLLAIVLVGYGTLNLLTLHAEATKAYVAELKPVAEVQGRVVFANPELDQALGSSDHSKITLPDLPSKDYYESFMDVRYGDVPLELSDGQFYQVWITNTKHSSYHPVFSFVVIDGAVNNVGGPGFIAYDHDTLKLKNFPVVLLSKETLSVAEINADMTPGEYRYYQGRKQAEPTNIIFEGLFAEVDQTTQELFNSIVLGKARNDTAH